MLIKVHEGLQESFASEDIPLILLLTDTNFPSFNACGENSESAVCLEHRQSERIHFLKCLKNTSVLVIKVLTHVQPANRSVEQDITSMLVRLTLLW